MMIIAAPQSGQTKVALIMPVGASASRGCVAVLGKLQQFTRLREVVVALSIGDQAIVANAMKAAGQDMQQEAAHELLGTEGHGLVAGVCLGPIILPAKGDAALVQGNESLIRDRHPMGIAGQISQHRRRPGKRAFSALHPFALAQWGKPVGEGRRVGERGVLTEELQPSAAIHLLEFFEEAPAKQS